MLEEHVLEERDPELNEEEDIKMEYSTKDYCRDVAEDGEYNSKIHSLKYWF